MQMQNQMQMQMQMQIKREEEDQDDAIPGSIGKNICAGDKTRAGSFQSIFDLVYYLEPVKAQVWRCALLSVASIQQY